MSKATVELGLNATDYQAGVSKVKAGLKSIADTAAAESAKAMAAMKQISTLELKKSRVSGDKAAEDAIQREIDLVRELDVIRRKAATEQDRIELSAMAHRRKNIADAQAIQRNTISANRKDNSRNNFRTANLGAQFQDVAIQAQMGTSWNTIIAQQGPQIVSALGGTGKMAGIAAGAGIAIAVTMGLASMVVNSGKAFKEMTDQARAAALDIGKISFTSSDQEGLVRGVEVYKHQLEKMRQAEIAGSSRGSRLLAWIDEHTGGESKESKDIEKANAKKQLEFARKQINERSLELSNHMLDIAKLTAENDQEGLERAENKFVLEQRRIALALSGLDQDELHKALEAEEAMSKAKVDAAENKRIKELRKEEADRIASASEDMMNAELALAEAAEKRLKLTDQIAIANGRVLSAEKEVAHQAKFGTEASQHRAAADLARARAAQQNLALERASQFVGRSSADVRKADREEAKRQKEVEKGKKRMEDAEVREADRKARAGGRPLTALEKELERGRAKLDKESLREEGPGRKSRGTGLSEVEKSAIRENVRKSLGGDQDSKAIQDSAVSLKTIENEMIKIRDQISAA